jgi:hypothetical protein
MLSDPTLQLHWKITAYHNFPTIQPISANGIPINSARKLNDCDSIKVVPNHVLGEQPGNLQTKDTQHSLFNRSTYFRRHYTPILVAR